MLEPIEEVNIECALEHQGPLIDKLMERKSEIVEMNNNADGTRCYLKMLVPTRGLIGYGWISGTVTGKDHTHARASILNP